MTSIIVTSAYLLLVATTQASAFVTPHAWNHHRLSVSQLSYGDPFQRVIVLNQSTRVRELTDVIDVEDAIDVIDVTDVEDVVVDVCKASEGKERYPESSTTKQTKNPLSAFSEAYSRLTSEHYLIMAFLQAGFLASGADITTQALEGANPIDAAHVAAMATVASTMSGVMNAIWLRQLEQAFPGTKTKQVAFKTLIHAIIIASIINSAYLAGVPLFTQYVYGDSGLTASNLSMLFGGWSWDEFIILTKLEILMFIPYNTLAFKFVPPQIRPLTHAAISATFNVAVSAVTLGYFDAWCERASTVFS